MTLRALFDKDRKDEIRRAIEKGEPLPFQRMKNSKPPESVRTEDTPVSEIRRFIIDERNSTDPTKQRLDRADAFLKAKASGIVKTYGKEEFMRAVATAKEKQQQALKGANVTYAPLEEEVLEMRELAKLIARFTEQLKSEDGLRAILGTSGKSGRVGP